MCFWRPLTVLQYSQYWYSRYHYTITGTDTTDTLITGTTTTDIPITDTYASQPGGPEGAGGSASSNDQSITEHENDIAESVDWDGDQSEDAESSSEHRSERRRSVAPSSYSERALGPLTERSV